MKIVKRIVQLTFTAAVLVLISLTLLPSKAEAAICSNDYFTGQVYCGGHQVLPSRPPYSIDHAMDDISNADQFLARVRGFLFDMGPSTRSLWGRAGTEFTVLSMLGYPAPHPDYEDARRRFADFENLVRQYDAAGRVNWNVWVGYPPNFVNSRVSRDYNMAGFYIDPNPQSQWTIVFYNPDGTTVMVKKNCANIVGSFSGRLQPLNGHTQGYKVEYGTRRAFPEFAAPVVSVQNLTTGAFYSAAGNPYFIRNIPSGYNYRITAQSPAGWQLKGFYKDFSVPGGPSFVNGSSYTFFLSPNETEDIWPAYERYFTPWLQVKQGNVLGGKITGQAIGRNGGRALGSTDKEAEFVIISYVGGVIKSFCSSNQYLFGGKQSGDSGCSGGLYAISNEYLTAKRLVSDLEITVGQAISGGNNCSKDLPQVGNLSVDGSGNIIQPGPNIALLSGSPCSNGVVWRYKGNATLRAQTIREGRGTYYIDGNLRIVEDVTSEKTNNLPITSVPNLGLIVKGDIVIEPNVRRIDAALFANSKIKTCGDNYKAAKCPNPLLVNGLMASIGGFQFGRGYVTSFDGSTGSAAETIAYQGKILVAPPPGFGESALTLNERLKYESNLPPRF